MVEHKNPICPNIMFSNWAPDHWHVFSKLVNIPTDMCREFKIFSMVWKFLWAHFKQWPALTTVVFSYVGIVSVLWEKWTARISYHWKGKSRAIPRRHFPALHLLRPIFSMRCPYVLTVDGHMNLSVFSINIIFNAVSPTSLSIKIESKARCWSSGKKGTPYE